MSRALQRRPDQDSRDLKTRELGRRLFAGGDQLTHTGAGEEGCLEPSCGHVRALAIEPQAPQ